MRPLAPSRRSDRRPNARRRMSGSARITAGYFLCVALTVLLVTWLLWQNVG